MEEKAETSGNIHHLFCFINLVTKGDSIFFSCPSKVVTVSNKSGVLLIKLTHFELYFTKLVLKSICGFEIKNLFIFVKGLMLNRKCELVP
jgi:hypothetical protein